MRRVFADTSFYLALLNETDAWHRDAHVLFSSLDAQVITTEYVLVELGSLMASVQLRSAYYCFVSELESDRTAVVVPATSVLFALGLELFRQRPDKNWSLTDCISFQVMARERVVEALSADHHFQQAGFTPLLVRT